MPETSVEEVLSRVELFAGLDKADLERVARSCVTRDFKAGEVIVREGEAGVAFYIIASGNVEVVRGLATANEQRLAVLGQGAFFGEMALFDNQLRSASVRAQDDVRCVVLTKWDFNAELNQNGQIGVAMLAVLARRIRELSAEAHTH